MPLLMFRRFRRTRNCRWLRPTCYGCCDRNHHRRRCCCHGNGSCLYIRSASVNALNESADSTTLSAAPRSATHTPMTKSRAFFKSPKICQYCRHDMSVAYYESPKCDPQKRDGTRKGKVGQDNSPSAGPNDFYEVKETLLTNRCEADDYSTTTTASDFTRKKARNCNETDDPGVTMERPLVQEQSRADPETRDDQGVGSDRLPSPNQAINQKRRQSQQQQQQVHQSYQGHSSAQPRLIPLLLRFYHRLFKSFRKAWTGVRFDDEVETIQVPAPRYQPEKIEDLLKRTKFNRNELKVMYQGFKQMCPSGLVDEPTFRDIYAQFFPQGDVTLYAHYLFMAFDQDHNGTVTFQDFVTGLSALSKGTPKEKLLWAFNLYDINGDGRITRDELIDIICSVYSLSADRERTDGADGDDRHSKYNEAQLSHADRVFQRDAS
ncbi:uncharacterized protein LOC111270413 isoform X2 [Varroa jacobsoni]|uniref:uncharacterized protein LOC111270413 isoform X2 n=1 Tax=Varroa jacobsoni TaxID=62625 RepID=UPI000BF633C1|nr:uncharacterized protein LOC111270413 isoform X2 [Varroa jacobsoni]